jgi:hypothetical protein
MQNPRVVLDTLMQSSTVDLFHSCGLAVAPTRRTRPESRGRHHELTAAVTFNARGFSGNLLVSVPDEVFALVRQDPLRPLNGRDWAREIANQLIGRVKARLLQFGVTLQTGLPTVVGKETAARQKLHGPSLVDYAFRTLRGEVVVTLSGDIDHSIFVYTRLFKVLSEGEIILF